MRLVIRAVCASALCVLLCAAVCAAPGDADFYYSGALDSVTGQSPASSAAEPARARVSEGMYYDFARRAYVYPVGEGAHEVYASVADGMIVTESVSISADDAAVHVYRDGEALENADLGDLDQAGSYVVAAKGAESTETLFGFRIIGQESNLSGGYSMPMGFYILDATRDGEETFYERSYIAMQDEGAYHIEYVCPANERRYTLETTIDRTPPRITLEGRQDGEGRFRSAVDVRGLARGDTVSMTFNDARAAFPSDGHLDESGVYTLRVTDSAGNTALEQFTILVYFDLNSLIFFALLCASLSGVLVYMLVKRKKLKVM